MNDVQSVLGVLHGLSAFRRVPLEEGWVRQGMSFVEMSRYADPDKLFELTKKKAISGDSWATQQLVRFQNQLCLDMDIAAYFWALDGFQKVTIDDVRAAGFMASDIKADSLSLVNPPWSSFVIELPTSLLGLTTTRGVEYITRVMVRCVGGKWTLLAYTDDSKQDFSHISRHEVPTTELVSFDPTDEPGTFHDDGSSLTDLDHRVQCALGKLVAGVCLAFSNPSYVKRTERKIVGATRSQRNKLQVPKVGTYEIGVPITVDCRRTIRDYLTGKTGTSPTVRSLVRGHWRNQACGTARLQRRAIWIEPFWRGPAGAPIVVRPHLVE